MKKWLEKERLWFYLEIGSEVAALVISGIYTFAVLAVGFSVSVTLVITGLLILFRIYGVLYILYRLLYLWRGTPNRVRWTVFCLIYVIFGLLPEVSIDSPLYLVSGLMRVVCSILAIACWVHDYGVITGAVEQKLPGEENAADSGDGN